MGTMRRALFAAAAVSAAAALTGPAPAGADSNKNVTPIFECAAPNSDGTFTAFFGYTNNANAAASIPVGGDNQFDPGPKDRGQPVVFASGRQVAVYSVRFSPDDKVSWHLGSGKADASSKTLCSTPAELSEASTWLALPGAAVVAIGIWFGMQRRRRRMIRVTTAQMLGN